MSIFKSFAEATALLGHTEALKNNNSVQTSRTIHSLDELKKLSRLFVSRELIEQRTERTADLFKNITDDKETSRNWLDRIEAYIYSDHPLSDEDKEKANVAFPMQVMTTSIKTVCLGVNEGWDIGTSTSGQFFIVDELVMNSGSYVVVKNTNLHLQISTINKPDTVQVCKPNDPRIKTEKKGPKNYDIGILGATGATGKPGPAGVLSGTATNGKNAWCSGNSPYHTAGSKGATGATGGVGIVGNVGYDGKPSSPATIIIDNITGTNNVLAIMTKSGTGGEGGIGGAGATGQAGGKGGDGCQWACYWERGSTGGKGGKGGTGATGGTGGNGVSGSSLIQVQYNSNNIKANQIITSNPTVPAGPGGTGGAGGAGGPGGAGGAASSKESGTEGQKGGDGVGGSGGQNGKAGSKPGNSPEIGKVKISG